jgi:hypothetical protein
LRLPRCKRRTRRHAEESLANLGFGFRSWLSFALAKLTHART